jgi:hypothetical protein
LNGLVVDVDPHLDGAAWCGCGGIRWDEQDVGSADPEFLQTLLHAGDHLRCVAAL